MEHVKQNDPGCLIPIQNIGCFFRSACLMAEYRTGKSLTAAQLNDLFNHAVEKRYIRDMDHDGKVEHFYTANSAGIATEALRVLGDRSGRFIEVGLFKDGVVSYYPAYKDTPVARIDALVQKIRQNGPNKTHFRLVDKTGNVIEDPHAPPIKCLRIDYSILYAYEA